MLLLMTADSVINVFEKERTMFDMSSPFAASAGVGLSLVAALSLLALAGPPMMGLLVLLPFMAALGIVRHQHILAMQECVAFSRYQRYLRGQEL